MQSDFALIWRAVDSADAESDVLDGLCGPSWGSLSKSITFRRAGPCKGMILWTKGMERPTETSRCCIWAEGSGGWRNGHVSTLSVPCPGRYEN